jgi:bifunctional DNA-binding transcriptional regulator/antitoxin component of YhaV-PrlF toxin-antitoxin module
MEVAIAKMSTKGQIVIPQEMRDCFPSGEKVFLMRDGCRVIMKPAKELSKNLKEDLEFARRTEEAYQRHEEGDVIVKDYDEFLKELKTW